MSIRPSRDSKQEPTNAPASAATGPPIRLGAVAYDSKVVSIWEGMQRYFRDEARLPLEVTLYLDYPAQVDAVVEGRIDIGWNTNLAYLQAESRSGGRCRPLAMRDTDRGWTTVIVSLTGGLVRRVTDLRGRTLALGSRDSGHAAILPVHFLEGQGLVEGRDYQALRFDLDVGKHGDTGTSELDVLRAVLDGRADAGAVGSPFWAGVQTTGIAPKGAVSEVWRSPAYDHCMFTARPDLPASRADAFVAALMEMDFGNPRHRPILEAEGLRKWLAPEDGYASLREAAAKQGFLAAPMMVRP